MLKYNPAFLTKFWYNLQMPSNKNAEPYEKLSVPESGEIQNPGAIDQDIELTMTNTISEVDDVVFSALKGVRRYQILRAPQEKLDEWKREVDKIASAIATKKLAQVRDLMKKGERLMGDADTVEKLISDENLDDTDIKLLAIGLFILREKSTWHARKSGLKVLKGGKVRMESAFEPEGWPNCYDIAAIVRELASMYGIEGELHGKGLSHAHFETEDGKVADPMYGWRRGGLFQNKEKFESFKKEMGLFRRMGIKK